MTASLNHAPLVVLLGPTAVGKTEIAIQLAERLDGEIISADSRLFYRGMDVGTAKPTIEEQARVPHHLIDVADPDEIWSLALFRRAAHNAIQEIHSRDHLPFLVGGTGQYIRAVIEGWQIPETGPDLRLRKALEVWAGQIGPQGMFDRLSFLDPLAASRMDPHNVRRTIRALEVILSTGARFSDQQRKGERLYRALLLGLQRPRPELYARIDRRIAAMLATGFVEEVRSLIEQGYSPTLPSFSAIGYSQIADCLAGKITLEEAVIQIKRLTRQFVRRQANWFKASDPNIHWFRVEAGTIDEVEMLITDWLARYADPNESASS